MRRWQQWVLGGVGALAVLLCMLYVAPAELRSDLGRWWWEQTHWAPELTLLLTRDATLGTLMGSHYFDTRVGQGAYDIARADRLYRWTLHYDPDLAIAWYQRARIAFLYGEHEKALALLETHLQLPDYTPRAWYLQGLVRGFLGRNEAAAESFLAYREYDSSSWYVYNNLAWVYFKLGDYARMRDITVAGLQHAPENPWLLMGQAMAWYNLGHATTAVALLKETQQRASALTPVDWSRTYPGNDPAIASLGLAEFRELLQQNVMLVEQSLNTTTEAN